MARSHDPFTAALEALRADLRDGAVAPGAPLIVVDLAKALRISPTPVREALSRLAGEGLVDEQRGRGFFARRLEAPDLVELYELHGAHIKTALELALKERSKQAFECSLGLQGAALPADPFRRARAIAEAVFEGLIKGADNRALSRAHKILSDQLALPRLAEAQVFSDLTGELEAMCSLQAVNDARALSLACARYHARRLDAAPDLAGTIRAGRPPLKKIVRI